MPRRALAALLLVSAASNAGAVDAAPEVLPWSQDLFERARRQHRPVLVLVRDPACAACLINEEEAFRDERTAALLGRAFVVGLVDRVRHPQVDDLMRTAAGWLDAGRGYPLAVALLPDGRPFAALAGITRDDAGDRPGLHRFALRAWSEAAQEPAAVEARAAATAQALARAQELAAPAAAESDGLAEAALRNVEQAGDGHSGGFGQGTAFAPPATLRLLLAAVERGPRPRASVLLQRTLDALAADPGPPATLAERALRIEALARGYALTGSPAYRARAGALSDGARGLRDAGGAFLAPGGSGSGEARVIAGWNGLMIGALALSGSLLDRPADVDLAREAARAVLARLGPPHRLQRSTDAAAPALLEDYAFLAEGLLRVDAASGGREPVLVKQAAALADAAVGRLLDPATGSFFDSVGEGAFLPPGLPARLRNGYDGDLPAANGVMVAVLSRLARQSAQPHYTELARRTLAAFSGARARAPRGMEGLAAAALELAPPAAVDAPSLPQPGPSYPARVDRDGVTFTAEVVPGGPERDAPLSLRLRLAIPPGAFVVAHDPGAPDLVGLSLSIPDGGARLQGPVRYPPSRRIEGRWGSGALNVLAGQPAVEATLAAPGRPARIRVRAVFQVCRDQAAACQRPDSVVLDAPVAAIP